MTANRIAAIDVDVQKTFTPLCPDELPVPYGDEIVSELNAQARWADLRVMTKDAHSPKALWVAPSIEQMLMPVGLPDADVSWVAHAVPGTFGFELLDGLPPVTDYDFLVYKGIEPDMHPYGACYHDLAGRLSTGLIEWLRQQKVSTVLLGGLAFDYCVKQTALQLKSAGFRVVINKAACRAISEETESSAAIELQAAGVELLDDSQAVGAWLMAQQANSPVVSR